MSALESMPSGSAAGPAVSSSSCSSSSTSSVYIYSRANFACPPLRNCRDTGKRAWPSNFRQSCTSSSLVLRVLLLLFRMGHQSSQLTLTPRATAAGGLEKGREGTLDVDVLGPSIPGGLSSLIPPQSPHRHQNQNHLSVLSMLSIAGIIAPIPRSGMSSVTASPMLSSL